MAKSSERLAVSENGFSPPVDEVLTGRGFVTGAADSGKSNTVSVVAEELLDRGLGLLIVDTDGEYAGLTERYEQVLRVGADDSCDRTVTAEDASSIADLALVENVSIVLDVSRYESEAVSANVVHAVARELFVAEKRHRKPFLLFVEDAHEFIPERGGGGDLYRILIQIAKRGHERGLGIVAISRLPAAVATDYITRCDWVVWHRLTWEHDAKVAGRILGGDATKNVRSLADREALVLTDWNESVSRVQFRQERTDNRDSTPTLGDAGGRVSPHADHVTGAGARPVDGRGSGAGGTTNDDSSRDQPSDWGLTVDASHPSLDATTREAVESTDGRGDRTSPAREQRTVAAETARAEPIEEHTDASIVTDSSEPSREKAAVDRRLRLLDDPEEYDPLWEIGQFIVYCYATITGTHAGIYRRFRRGYTDLCLRLRRSAFGTYPRGGPGRAERRAGTALAMMTVLVLYVLLAGVVVAGIGLYR